MFKDLMQAIFTEEVEPEETETEVEEERSVQQEPQVVKQEKPTFVEPAISLDTTTIQEPEIAQFGQATEKREETHSSLFTGLDVDSIASEEPKPRKKPYHFDRSKTMKIRRSQEDLEYKPIISPIFGNMEEDKKDNSKVHNAIDLHKPDQPEDYMTVLSPMYGDKLDVVQPARRIPKMNTQSAKSERKTSKSSLSLDDMLKTAPKEKNQQTTLFSQED